MSKCLTKNMDSTIHGYKHDGKVHRIWEHARVLRVTNDMVVVGNLKTKVIESNGRIWHTKEPAICYFFFNRWFNIISMIRSNGIHYYCNIASPAVWDGEAIKFIDYDLDLKVFPDNSFKILDENEYARHKILMDYPQDLDPILRSELDSLILMCQNEEIMFERKTVLDDYELLIAK